MPLTPTADSGTHRPYARMAGTEPLPGYTLLEPLGRGGFGEVWKCEAPGGLLKAVKFVAASGKGEALRQELAAFEQIKAIRHPFLLTLERVELVKEDLVMVMELADCQLQDRFRDCVNEGLPGIPRDELLGYLADAAEALDMIAARFGLQHLDVKPANLFLTSGRVKVGDYGLVVSLDGGANADPDGNRGLTPKYVAPEVLRGSPSPHSDQYSLALVYQELLTGTFPYTARNPQHLMLQHVTAKPDLSGLPESDRPVVARALTKEPGGRYAACLEFVRELMLADGTADPVLAFRQSRGVAGASRPDFNLPPTDLTSTSTTGRHRANGEATQNITLRSVVRRTTTGGGLPPLVAARRSIAPPQPVAPPPLQEEEDLPLVDESDRVILDPIRSIVPVVRLLGPHWAEVHLTARQFAAAVVEVAANGAYVPELPGDLGRLPDGTSVCQFPSTVPPQVAPLKLAVVREYWNLPMDQPDPSKLVFRKAAAASLWGSFSGKQRAAMEVVVNLPKPGKTVGEVTVTGSVIGTPDGAFARSALDAIPKVIADVRRELGNVEDRRKHPRLATNMPVTIYAMHSDGGIDPPIAGRCRDVSAGGIGFVTAEPLKTKYVYVSFDGVAAASGLAFLVQLVRKTPAAHGREVAYGGQYRMDF